MLLGKVRWLRAGLVNAFQEATFTLPVLYTRRLFLLTLLNLFKMLISIH